MKDSAGAGGNVSMVTPDGGYKPNSMSKNNTNGVRPGTVGNP